MSKLLDLKNALISAVKKEISNEKKIAILFSGGLDSSVLAQIAKSFSPPILVTVGVKNSKDVLFAEKIATELSLPHILKIVSEKEVHSSLPIVEKELKKVGLNDFLQLQIGVSEFLAFQAVKELGYTHVLTGLGADSLFLGFDYFRDMLKTSGEKEVKNFQHEQLENDIWKVDVAREKILAKYFNLTVHFPYLHPRVISSALSLPVSENIHSPSDLERKHSLRAIALELHVPKQAASRKKSAIQYGSGISKILQKMKH